MSVIMPETLFRELSGEEILGFAAIHSPVHRSPGGIHIL